MFWECRIVCRWFSTAGTDGRWRVQCLPTPPSWPVVWDERYVLFVKNQVWCEWHFILGATFRLSQGLRNDLKAALDKIDQQYLNELVGGQEPGEEDTQNDLKVHEENTTIEELEVISTPTLPRSPSHLSFRAANGWVHEVAQCRAHCHCCLRSLQRPFYHFMLSFINSLLSHCPRTFIPLLPAFKSSHSDTFDMHCFVCWCSSKTSETSSVLGAWVFDFHKWCSTVKFFLLLTFPFYTLNSVFNIHPWCLCTLNLCF